MEHKIAFGTIPWESSAKGVRFKPYILNGKRMRLVEFSREFVESDWCEKGHIGYILEGQMEIDFSGERIIFNHGDGLFIPEGEDNKHKAKIL
jgi:quercetin dioxygenase-like cupin family protein